MSKWIGQFITTDVRNHRIDDVFPQNLRARIGKLIELRSEIISPETLVESATQDVDFLFSTWGMPALDEETIKTQFPNLKAVFYGAGSVQGFARPFLRSGVRVFSAWGANGVPVAEYTIAQIVLANKGFYQSSRAYKETGDMRAAARYLRIQPGNYHAKVGILGAGMIGRMVLERLREYTVDVLLFDAFLSEAETVALGAKKASLDEVFATCDVISNHIGNNEQTRGMLRYEHFSKMLPHATFLNTGRGQQVIEEDMVRALREGPDRTAVLDVTYPEPVEVGSPLRSLPNVVLTPHIAGSAGMEVERMGLYMVEEMEHVVRGEKARFEVSEAMLKTMA